MIYDYTYVTPYTIHTTIHKYMCLCIHSFYYYYYYYYRFIDFYKCMRLLLIIK